MTAATAVLLLLLLATEGATIVFMGPLLWVHLFVGMLLIPPVLLKLGSTGYRFSRYYLGDRAYRERGAPHDALRVMGPLVVLTTVGVLATGVVLLFAGPRPNTLILVHKVFFFAWLGLMTIHVLAHIGDVVRFAPPDWRRAASAAGQPVPGEWPRRIAIGLSLIAGAGLALATASHIGPWLSARG